MKEAITYIINSSTVAIVEGPYEADDHGIEHHTVSPITFKGDSSPKSAVLLEKAPDEIRNRITETYERVIGVKSLSQRNQSH